MIKSSVPLILASQSPRRAALLSQIGLVFTVQPSNIEETIHPDLSFERNVQTLALHKAENIVRKTSTGVILGSDTIVVINNQVLGKPSSAEEAISMLHQLSGNTHTVYTGFAFVDAGTKKSYIDYERTEVTFRILTNREIEEYVTSGSPMDKAGAYGIQDDFGAVFVERISGDYYTVVGLPLSKVYRTLTTFLNECGYLEG